MSFIRVIQDISVAQFCKAQDKPHQIVLTMGSDANCTLAIKLREVLDTANEWYSRLKGAPLIRYAQVKTLNYPTNSVVLVSVCNPDEPLRR